MVSRYIVGISAFSACPKGRLDLSMYVFRLSRHWQGGVCFVSGAASISHGASSSPCRRCCCYCRSSMGNGLRRCPWCQRRRSRGSPCASGQQSPPWRRRAPSARMKTINEMQQKCGRKCGTKKVANHLRRRISEKVHPLSFFKHFLGASKLGLETPRTKFHKMFDKV